MHCMSGLLPITRPVVLLLSSLLLPMVPEASPLVLAQTQKGDHYWNLRENNGDRFNSNDAWLRPWRYDYDDGWGRWVGAGDYELQWGSVVSYGYSDGSFTIMRDADRHFHAWTYVYMESAKTITYNASGDCVPRIFLNYAFDSPLQFPATLSLHAGWNRLDMTGYNQVSGFTFHCDGLVNLVDIMHSREMTVGRPPVAEAGGPYVGAREGRGLILSGSGSSDPDGDTLLYRWKFGYEPFLDTPWYIDPTGYFTPGDDLSVVTLEVTDGLYISSDTAQVTAENVAPQISGMTIGLSNPPYALVGRTCTFSGRFSDAGWLDTHTSTWDFGDGTTAPGSLTESHQRLAAIGETHASHIYTRPGTCILVLSITDDDGAVGTSWPRSVTVIGPVDLVQQLDSYIQGLPDRAFDSQPKNRRRWFARQLNSATQAIATANDTDALYYLQTVRDKADGIGKGDYLIDPVARQKVCAMIDEIASCLSLP